ncbi:hypothetical protein MHYP_G00064150, partial [Metynnis hypsauchen]
MTSLCFARLFSSTAPVQSWDRTVCSGRLLQNLCRCNTPQWPQTMQPSHRSSAGLCAPEVRVHKNTVYRASSKSPLRVPCPVRYCEQIPTVRWFRINDRDQAIPVSETDQVTVTQDHPTADEKEIISYLSFKSLSVQDDGIYRCEAVVSNSTSPSHNINVSVS